MRSRALLSVAAGLLVAACANSSGASLSSRASAPTPSGGPSVSEVTFPARDGVGLHGRLFGNGAVGVVLAHGTVDNAQESWSEFARILAEHGFRALTFNFRGTETSIRPILWRDVAGAVDYLHRQGVAKVFVIGASLGAHIALCAAAQPGVAIAGVVAVSSGPGGFCAETGLTPSAIGSIPSPLLVLAGKRDEILSSGDAQALYAQAKGPKSILMIDTSAHGAPLLAGPAADAEKARQEVLDFLAKYS